MKSAFAVKQAAPGVIKFARASTVRIPQKDGECEHGNQSAEQVLGAASALGVDCMRYARYATIRWGLDWPSHADRCREALDQIGRYRHDPEGLIDKIETELRVAESEQR